MVDAECAAAHPSHIPRLAKTAEDYGFDCFWVNETKHDAFVQLALGAASTSKIGLGSSIAVAFSRSPTTTAYAAWDLQSLSEGRFILGLGSQVKGHIERRFGMKWEAPAPKMREAVLAVKTVWDSWQKGTKLDFQGRFYRLDLMTPFFSPGPISHPTIPVYVAGVNEGMCRVAGLVADGLHVHPLHSVRYLREVILPSVDRGLAKAGRKRGDFAVAASVFAAAGSNRKEIDHVKEAYREQVAFYASTRTYRRQMEIHGWGDVGERLHQLSVGGKWDRMTGEVGDEILEEFVVEGTWGELGKILKGRYAGLVDRVRLYLPFDGERVWSEFVSGFRA